MQQVGKDRKVYEHLKVALPLLSGQALLVGPAAETSGVGEHFFTLREPLPRRTLLLVRIAQTQQDELFQQPAQSDAVYSITD